MASFSFPGRTCRLFIISRAFSTEISFRNSLRFIEIQSRVPSTLDEFFSLIAFPDMFYTYFFLQKNIEGRLAKRYPDRIIKTPDNRPAKLRIGLKFKQKINPNRLIFFINL